MARKEKKMFDGIPVKLNKKYGYRMSNPLVDKDLKGNPVSSNYISIVKISDCTILEKNGKNYYNSENAPSIPLSYGGTYYGYGQEKRRSSEQGVWINNKLCYEYIQYNVYFVNDGRVYTASRKATLESRREHARYEIGTDTIRKIPENYCLIAWNENGDPIFDVDRATIKYRELIEESYNYWSIIDFEQIGIEKTGIEQKEVLATIISNKFKQL
jgi:hypothetical protein